MLCHYLDNLKNTIQWACMQDDIDILSLARDRHNQLLDYVQTLPTSEQQLAHQHIDGLLPMEWPLWMEACRYDDGADAKAAVVLH